MNDQTETDTQFMQRMIAMLLSLAGIAERAANRPYPVRAFLLWVLRRAETAMQDYVGVEDLLAHEFRGNRPDDALNLADSFRELAFLLREDLEQDQLYLGWWSEDKNAGDNDAAEGLFARIAHLIAAVIRLSRQARPESRPGFAPRLDSS